MFSPKNRDFIELLRLIAYRNFFTSVSNFAIKIV